MKYFLYKKPKDAIICHLMYTKFTKGCDNSINFRAMKSINVDGDEIRMKLNEIGEHQSTITIFRSIIMVLATDKMLIAKRRGEEVVGKDAR